MRRIKLDRNQETGEQSRIEQERGGDKCGEKQSGKRRTTENDRVKKKREYIRRGDMKEWKGTIRK